MKKKILCVGELVIDFIAIENKNLSESYNFLKTPGGAPANVAVTIQKLGGKSYFVGTTIHSVIF